MKTIYQDGFFYFALFLISEKVIHRELNSSHRLKYCSIIHQDTTGVSYWPIIRFGWLLLCVMIFVSIPLQAQYANEQVIKKLEEEFNIKIYYKQEWLDGKQLNIQNYEEKAQALRELVRSLGLTYIERGTRIFLMPDQQQAIAVRVGRGAPNQRIILGNKLNVVSDSVVLNGKVIDANAANGLPGILIQVDGKESSVTEINGDYAIDLAIGNHRLAFSTVGMETSEVEIEIYENASLDVDMYESSTLLEEIIISEQEDYLYRQPLASLAKINEQQLRNAPMLLGERDIIRMAVSQPGVNSIGEGSAGFNVRGGQATQNQLLLDGVTLYNPYHLFGFIPSYNPYIIDEALLYKGGVPASYGGWVSSVLQTNTKTPSMQDFKANFSAGLINSALNVEFPVIENKLSVMSANRFAYPDYLIHGYRNVDLQSSSYQFRDHNLLIHYLPVDTLKSIDAQYIAMHDALQLAEDASFQFTNSSIGLQYKTTDYAGKQNRIGLSRTLYRFDFEDFSEAINYLISGELQHHEIDYITTRPMPNEALLSYGGEILHYQLNPGAISYSTQASSRSVAEDGYFLQKSLLPSLHATWDQELGESVNLSIGLRVGGQIVNNDTTLVFQNNAFETTGLTDTLFNQINFKYLGMEPRISLSYQYAPKTSLKFSYQRSRQFINQVNNSFAINPIDLWTLSNQNLKPVVSDRFVLGWFKKLTHDLNISLEGYYGLMQHVYEFKQGARPYNIFIMETSLIQGKGRSFGLELSVQKQKGKLTGNFNYSFSRTFLLMKGDSPGQSINGGKFYPANFDIPHSFQTSWVYDVSRQFDLILNVTAQSGRPVTFPTSSYRLNDRVIYDFAERNNERVPYYARMDLSVNWYTSIIRKNKRVRTFWNFTYYNATGRDNLLNVFFEPSNNLSRFPSPTSFGILQQGVFSVSYNVTFK